MHIEKNVYDSLIGLLLNIPGKTKDVVNVRKDMVQMGIRLELAPVENDRKRTYLPPACYTMSKTEKMQFCQCLHDIKVPSSYSVNINRLVSVKDCKILGMKSHDCHVLMTHMIPIALHGLLLEHIRQTITKLCLFFIIIHLKVIDPDVLDSWFRPEGSIVEGYATEEVVEFCTDYLKGIDNIGISRSRHQGRLLGVGTIGSKNITPDRGLLQLAHFAVLQHMACVALYIIEHMKCYVWRIRGKTAHGLKYSFKSYQAYEINGYVFYTQTQDEKSVNQNSGVTLIASTTERNRIAKESYYGVIQEIWELDYNSFTIPLFKYSYAYEPFILAKLATQVFYVKDLIENSRWHAVLQSKRHILGVDEVVDEDEYDHLDELPSTYLRSDHDEGLWIDKPRRK
nr:hypothetical protein [Tanacetum cinerariifolium]